MGFEVEGCFTLNEVLKRNAAIFRFVVLMSVQPWASDAQEFPHPQAHAHNDYEHVRPLFDALSNGFMSVEADVHLKDGALLVAHNRLGKRSRTLRELYLKPLDSLLEKNGSIYPGHRGTFLLMIDCKTESESTLRAIQKELSVFPSLLCRQSGCPVQVFLSGNRALETMTQEMYNGIALDGRPDDLGRGFSVEMMPVVSDNYGKWCRWDGRSEPNAGDLDRIRELAGRVHAEGKKLRLWAIPDNERTWTMLLSVGVDLINSDRLEELHRFLETKK